MKVQFNLVDQNNGLAFRDRIASRLMSTTTGPLDRTYGGGNGTPRGFISILDPKTLKRRPRTAIMQSRLFLILGAIDMKEQRFWKCAAVTAIGVGIYIGHGLHGSPNIDTGRAAYAVEPQEKPGKAKATLTWQNIEDVGSTSNFRSKIPGGWLVNIVGRQGVGLTFVPDSEHKWDGTSVP